MSVENNDDQSQERIISVEARGSEIEPWMTDDDIESLKLKMREDKDLRRNLAVFLSMEVHIERDFDGKDEINKFQVGATDAQLAVHNYQVVESVLSYEGLWPENVSPPEFIDDAINRLEASGVESVRRPDFDREKIQRNLGGFTTQNG